jgi:opacity protein-like surface antigen
VRKLLVGVLAYCVVSASVPVFAEGFFDIYAGGSFTDTASVKISSNAAATSGDVSLENDTTYGLRGGYWLKNLPWLGFGGDFSSLHTRGKNTKFDILPITPMALFRLPLFVDEEIPQGRLQPYIGIGPSISLYTYAHADLGPPTNSISGTSSIGSAVGFQLPVGIAIQLTRRVALFSEYRYAYYKVDVDQDLISQFIGSTWNSDNVARNVKTDLSMHNVLLGISFRF